MPSRRKLLQTVLPALVLVLVAFCWANSADACPNCKAGMSTDDAQARNMAAGYYYSILFMLSMPLLIVTSFSAWMFVAVRKAQRERDAAAARVASDESAGVGVEGASPRLEYESVGGRSTRA